MKKIISISLMVLMSASVLGAKEDVKGGGLWSSAYEYFLDVFYYNSAVGYQFLYDDDALRVAVEAGYLGVVKRLVELGADTDRVVEGGYTAVTIAAYYGHLDIVEYLLKYAVGEEDLKEVKGKTALHYAAQLGNVDLVDILVHKELSSIGEKARKGFTALHYAVMNSHYPLKLSR